MSTITETTVQIYQVFIKATPEQIWEAIIDPGVHDEVLPRVADHGHARVALVDLSRRRRVLGRRSRLRVGPASAPRP